MSDTGIIIPLKERVRDLEVINEAHQKKNGQLRQEIQDKDKLIKLLTEKINNPTKKMREQGQL
jgi:cell division protein FtsB